MDRNKIRRRKQFSSCDACRQSRVGCDAAQGHGSTNNATLFSCTRCASRNKLCTFEVGRALPPILPVPPLFPPSQIPATLMREFSVDEESLK